MFVFKDVKKSKVTLLSVINSLTQKHLYSAANCNCCGSDKEVCTARRSSLAQTAADHGSEGQGLVSISWMESQKRTTSSALLRSGDTTGCCDRPHHCEIPISSPYVAHAPELLEAISSHSSWCRSCLWSLWPSTFAGKLRSKESSRGGPWRRSWASRSS